MSGVGCGVASDERRIWLGIEWGVARAARASGGVTSGGKIMREAMKAIDEDGVG